LQPPLHSQEHWAEQPDLQLQSLHWQVQLVQVQASPQQQTADVVPAASAVVLAFSVPKPRANAAISTAVIISMLSLVFIKRPFFIMFSELLSFTTSHCDNDIYQQSRQHRRACIEAL